MVCTSEYTASCPTAKASLSGPDLVSEYSKTARGFGHWCKEIPPGKGACSESLCLALQVASKQRERILHNTQHGLQRLALHARLVNG